MTDQQKTIQQAISFLHRLGSLEGILSNDLLYEASVIEARLQGQLETDQSEDHKGQDGERGACWIYVSNSTSDVS